MGRCAGLVGQLAAAGGGWALELRQIAVVTPCILAGGVPGSGTCGGTISFVLYARHLGVNGDIMGKATWKRRY